jgi:hypothetical protein
MRRIRHGTEALLLSLREHAIGADKIVAIRAMVSDLEFIKGIESSRTKDPGG